MTRKKWNSWKNSDGMIAYSGSVCLCLSYIFLAYSFLYCLLCLIAYSYALPSLPLCLFLCLACLLAYCPALPLSYTRWSWVSNHPVTVLPGISFLSSHWPYILTLQFFASQKLFLRKFRNFKNNKPFRRFFLSFTFIFWKNCENKCARKFKKILLQIFKSSNSLKLMFAKIFLFLSHFLFRCKIKKKSF